LGQSCGDERSFNHVNAAKSSVQVQLTGRPLCKMVVQEIRNAQNSGHLLGYFLVICYRKYNNNYKTGVLKTCKKSHTCVLQKLCSDLYIFAYVPVCDSAFDNFGHLYACAGMSSVVLLFPPYEHFLHFCKNFSTNLLQISGRVGNLR